MKSKSAKRSIESGGGSDLYSDSMAETMASESEVEDYSGPETPTSARLQGAKPRGDLHAPAFSNIISEDENVLSETSGSEKMNVASDSEEDIDYSDTEMLMPKEKEKLTSRQRSMLHGQHPHDTAPSASSIPTRKSISTLNTIQISEKARLRRMNKEKEVEESKIATIDKLLNKSSAAGKRKSDAAELSSTQAALAGDGPPIDIIRYIDNRHGTYLCLPDTFPLR